MTGPETGADEWTALLDRAAALDREPTTAAIGEALASRRAGEVGGSREGRDGAPGEAADPVDQSAPGSTSGGDEPVDGEEHPDPTLVVADADVLAADLLVGGDARAAMDLVRGIDALTPVASDALLADAAAVIASVGDDPALAADWRAWAGETATVVSIHPGDHPALAAARAGNAAHLLTLDETLTGVDRGLAIKRHVTVSVKTPDAFAAVVDPASLAALADDRSRGEGASEDAAEDA